MQTNMKLLIKSNNTVL